jgi:glycosyltransferase involved in cell wall biosynthesis
MNKISVVIITYNEESRIQKTLESVKWCDEIIVVDSGSTDKTTDICKEYTNCKVYHQSFLGFGLQKRFAIEKASNDWILSLDADEIVTEPLKKEMENTLQNPLANGYNVPITMLFMGKVFKYGNEHKMPHLRFFNKNKGNFNSNEVHEAIQVEGKILTFRNEVLHQSYRNTFHYFEKFNTYTEIYKNEALKKRKKAGMLKSILRFKLEFIKLYFFRFNFLNGYPGFVWSMYSAFYVFVKFNKIYEANLTHNE